MPSGIWGTIPEGTTVITANQRLAKAIRKAFDQSRLEEGREAWNSCDVLPLSAWLERCWDLAMDAGASLAGEDSLFSLLSPEQTLVLWEQVIEEITPGHELMQVSQAAESARKAEELLVQWQTSLPALDTITSDETKVFLQWQKAFHQKCAQRGWIDPVHLPDLIGQWMSEGLIPRPNGLHLAGFDDIPPQTKSLLELCKTAGVSVEIIAPPQLKPGQGPALVFPCEDLQTEMEEAARWAKGLLDGGGSSIGVVVPELEKIHTPLKKTFSDVLAPGHIFPGAEVELPVNFSDGPKLSSYSLVQSALHLITPTRGKIEFQKASSLIRNPYLPGADTEFFNRLQLDLMLRNWQQDTISPRSISQAALKPAAPDQTKPNSHAPVLGRFFENLSQWENSCPAKQKTGAWAESFSALFSLIKFPHHLNSGEYQIWEKWKQLLEAFSSLDEVMPAISQGEAAGRLRMMAAKEPFQPETAESPIQVLGVLEAGGLEFEHFWVMGLHETAWPRPPAPNPFLPLAWQRKAGLPRASASRELEFARRLTGRLLAAGKEVVLSYPEHDHDQKFRRSPLIKEVPEGMPSVRDDTSLLIDILSSSGVLTSFIDDSAPPFPSGENAKGGSGLFRDQAACPFRAFARYRLFARTPSSPTTGLEASTQGTLFHQAMSLLWGELKDHQTLLSKAEKELDALTFRIAQETLETFGQSRPDPFPPRFMELETNRIASLMREDLELEKVRAPFTVVAREQKSQFQIGGVEVSLSIDRMDELADGGKIILDYKTGSGKNTVSSWFSERPDDPQIPLYSVMIGADLKGMAFAEMRTGDVGYRGLAPSEAALKGTNPYPHTKLPGEAGHFEKISDFQGHWRLILEQLAEDFRNGEAFVSPKNPTTTCKYCDISLLCRFQAQDTPEEGEEA